MAATVAQGVEECRALEVERLNALMAAHWDRALAGVGKSADIVLKAIEAQSEIMGLIPSDAKSGAKRLKSKSHDGPASIFAVA